MTTLYNLRALTPTHYQMAKFDADFNVAAIYNLTPKGRGYACDCPAGQRSVKLKPCKHQRMMILMMGACNTNRFYDPETGSWCEPLSQEPAVIDQREVEMEIEPEILHLSETEAAAKIKAEGLTVEEAVYGFTKPEPPKPQSMPVITRRI